MVVCLYLKYFLIGAACAVILNFQFLETGIIASVVAIAFNLLFYLDAIRIFRKERINYASPSLKIGFQYFRKSITLTIKILLENLKNQGVRLILLPMVGLEKLAAFATIRTGANFSMQGLNTITNPLMPELMRFLHHRDQKRFDSSIALIWTAITFLFAPLIVITQLLAKPIFQTWTHGKIPFNPLLFAILSTSVLIFGWSQPAIAIIRGNNLLRDQLKNSVFAVLITIIGIGTFVPLWGITGGGLALLASEIYSAIQYRKQAGRCVKK